MKKMFLPAVRIPGAHRVDELDKKGKRIQVWKKPHPLGFVYHWKNAAMKLRYFDKPTEEWTKNKDKWFKAVPIHEGVDNNLFRYLNYKRKFYLRKGYPPLADLTFDWKLGRWFPVAE